MTWQTFIELLSMGEYNFFVWSAILSSWAVLLGFHWLSWKMHHHYKCNLVRTMNENTHKPQTVLRVRESNR